MDSNDDDDRWLMMMTMTTTMKKVSQVGWAADDVQVSRNVGKPSIGDSGGEENLGKAQA